MTRLTKRDVVRLLDSAGLSPRKTLGQHFVVDPGTIERIVRLAGVAPGDRVLEVGPGLGSLTRGLLDAGCEVVAVEKDAAIAQVLRGQLDGRVRVVTADALRADLGALLEPRGPWTLVANLPYNIATPLVLKVLESVPSVTRQLVMVQREVGERLAAAAGTRAAGAPSVKVAALAEARIVGNVAPEVFFPRPRVASALVRLDRRPHPRLEEVDGAALWSLVRDGFAQRRKTLRRSLAGHMDDAAFVRAGLTGGERPEQLSLDQWLDLASAMPA